MIIQIFRKHYLTENINSLEKVTAVTRAFNLQIRGWRLWLLKT